MKNLFKAAALEVSAELLWEFPFDLDTLGYKGAVGRATERVHDRVYVLAEKALEDGDETLVRGLIGIPFEDKRKAAKREALALLKTTGIDFRVAAIRADRKVGRGTCSWIDECLSDAELAAELDKAGKRSPDAAVKWARAAHKVWEDIAEDIRNA
jgi:hypothetical protein